MSAREYVLEVFEKTPRERLKEVESEVRQLIHEKSKAGLLHSTNWDEMEFPKFVFLTLPKELVNLMYNSCLGHPV